MALVKNSMLNLGFRLGETVPPKRMAVAVGGMRGKGKSHFCLTAPGPIAVFNLDVGLRGVIERFSTKKTLVVMDILVPPTQEEAVKQWNRFYPAWQAALKATDTRLPENEAQDPVSSNAASADELSVTG